MVTIPTIGEMRQVLSFEKVVKGTDATGGQTETPEPWFTTRGKLKYKRGFRDFETGYDSSIKVYDCWIRWRNAVEVDMTKDVRVMFEARSFGIEFFTMVDEARKIYHLELKELR
jgi:head-tail adaptor